MTGKTKNIISRLFIDQFQGTVMANFAKNDLQATKAIISIISSDQSLAFFKENFIKNGGTVENWRILSAKGYRF